MYHTITLPHYQNNCKICSSLDYVSRSPKNSICVKKSMIKLRHPFQIFKVPDHLLEVILEKMHYNTFLRFRQTNKQYSEFIERRRDFLRIAWYHDKSVNFIVHVDNEFRRKKIPRIQFDSIFFRNCCRLSAKAAKQIEDIELIREKRSITDRLLGTANYFRRRPVNIDLKDWEENLELRRELKGCYIPVTISIEEEYNTLPGAQWEYFLSIFDQFLSWARIKNNRMTLETASLNYLRSAQICSLFPVQTWKINDQTAELILKHFYFPNTQHTQLLFLNRCAVPKEILEAIPNLRVLNVHGDAGIDPDCLESILDGWLNGSISLREIEIETKIHYSVEFLNIFKKYRDEGDAKLLSKKEVMPYLIEGFPDFNRLWEDTTLRSFLLEKQCNTTRKALCIIRGKHTYQTIYVKTLVENVDDKLG